MLTDTESRVPNAGLCMSFIPPHSAAPSPYSVYKEGFQQKEKYIFYTYASAHFQRFMLKKASLTVKSRSKMHWQGSCTTREGEKLLGATPCTRTHGQTHTEAHGNEDNLLQKSYTQPGVRLQRLGVCVLEDPVLPGSPRTHRVSQWMSTATKRSIPEKGPVRAATTLLFSSCISEVPSCLPGLSGRLQRTRDGDAGSQFRWSLRSN